METATIIEILKGCPEFQNGEATIKESEGFVTIERNNSLPMILPIWFLVQIYNAGINFVAADNNSFKFYTK
jgi:hypothetical protein